VGLRKTTDRNRQIYTAFAAGRTMGELGQDYGLTEFRIRAILFDEGHRRVVSPELFYCEIRGGKVFEG
jgi:Mor family transcriptional regulator